MTALRGAAFAVGVVLLLATAHATISATGGYSSAHSFVTLAIAAGVCVSALAIGSAWGERPLLAGWLVVAILAGEAFGFLSTAERLVAGREAAQVPLKAAADAYAKASRRVAEAVAALDRPSASPRLAAALAAKVAAGQAATDKSTERGCRDNCRQLLQAQADAAEREVAAARGELATAQASSKVELDASRAALAALKAPASATPLADRVGVAAWALDLLSAMLGSIAANGLGCGLISFAGHRHRRDAPATQASAEAVDDPAEPAPDCVQRFAFDRLFPAQSDAGADVLAIKAEFRRWCEQRGVAPPSGAALGQAMADLFERVGIALQQRNGRLMAVGVVLKADQGALPNRGHSM
jgi:hypothetical protein